MNELEVVEKMQGNENVPVIDSREVAKMVGMRHADLCRDIDHYIEVMGQNPKLGSDDFFIGLKFFGVRTGGTQAGHWAELYEGNNLSLGLANGRGARQYWFLTEDGFYEVCKMPRQDQGTRHGTRNTNKVTGGTRTRQR